MTMCASHKNKKLNDILKRINFKLIYNLMIQQIIINTAKIFYLIREPIIHSLKFSQQILNFLFNTKNQNGDYQLKKYILI